MFNLKSSLRSGVILLSTLMPLTSCFASSTNQAIVRQLQAVKNTTNVKNIDEAIELAINSYRIPGFVNKAELLLQKGNLVWAIHSCIPSENNGVLLILDAVSGYKISQTEESVAGRDFRNPIERAKWQELMLTAPITNSDIRTIAINSNKLQGMTTVEIELEVEGQTLAWEFESINEDPDTLIKQSFDAWTGDYIPPAK